MSPPEGRLWGARLLCLVAVLCPTAVSGQVLTSLELSLSNPGARSMGFGGAFVALADDATAAFANPAGLVQIPRPEVSAELRAWRYETPYTRGGRAAGEPTGIGIDTAAGPLEAFSSEEVTGLSFASVVYPLRRWRLALFQHQLLNFEASQEIQGLFRPGAVFAGTDRGPIERASFDLEIVTTGLAAAMRLNDELSFGIGLSHFAQSGSITGREYLPDDASRESFFGAASFLPERLVAVYGIDFDDRDWAPVAGLRWSASPRWQLGAVYRQGPDLELSVRAEAGPAHPLFPPGALIGEVTTGWSMPDVFGVGIAYSSPGGRWAAGFEWDRVGYSAIIESLDPRLEDPGDTLDDGDELHLGAERTFLGATPLWAVRVGLWRDPDHRVRTESGDPTRRAELPLGEDELHLAAGFGIAFERFQLDLGIDLSERSDTASLSVVYSF